MKKLQALVLQADYPNSYTYNVTLGKRRSEEETCLLRDAYEK